MDDAMRIALIHALKHSILPIEQSFAWLWPEARTRQSAGRLRCRPIWRAMAR